MSFMSYEEILEAVKNKEIEVSYRAVKDLEKDEILPLYQMKPVNLDEIHQDDKTRIIKEYFLDSFKDDSMYFHVGQAAKLEFTDRNKDEKKYLKKMKDGSYIFNIEESKKLTLHPQESVIVGTNEYIKLSENIGASIYATVSKTNIGFSHISTIIDPLWEGFLQISITNFSRYSQGLDYLDEFCTVRFHRLKSERTTKKNYEKLKKKLYFGNTWWNQNGEMLPRGYKYNAESTLQREISGWLNRLAQLFWILLGAAGIGAIVGLIFFLGALSNKISILEEVRKDLNSNTVSIAEIRKDVANLDKQVLLKGINEVNFSVSQSSDSISIPFNEPLSTRPMFFVELEGLPRDQITYAIDYPPRNSNKDLRYNNVVIKLLYTGNKSLKGNVKWLVVYGKQ